VTAEQWRRARELFEAAVDDPPADLSRWLAERCDDEVVRREVASLMTHHTRAGEFLTRPAGDLAELLEETPPFAPGQTVGPYRIDAEAGRGGMGRVHRAKDTRLNRTVAIKALPSELAPDPSQRERLRREARAAAALSHPGICTVYALEEVEGSLYIVTEYIDGRTLHDEIVNGDRPSYAWLIDTSRQLASALASAHAAGITHRDLKPENVMRTVDGRIKILDFGLARQPLGALATAGGVSMVTQAGAVIGTPAYMAPEHLNGQPADLRTDVFAFGVLMYEYATGRHPFDAPTAIARAGRVLTAEPEPVGRYRADLPASLVSVLDRCLAKAPDERFASAIDVMGALPEAETVGSRAVPLVGPPSSATALGDTSWWRMHQFVVIGLYFVAVIVAWFVKEGLRGPTSAVFIAMSVLGTVLGMLRGHLVFTASTHAAGLPAQRRRVTPITLVGDLLMATLLAGDGLGWIIGASREVAGVLTIALAVGLVVARLVLEPTTTKAAFGG
jgi:hypothetical protein